MAVFRGIALHLWSAHGLTAEWHDGHQGPYLRIHEEAGHTGTLHALPGPFQIPPDCVVNLSQIDMSAIILWNVNVVADRVCTDHQGSRCP
jgi:hypothetical protein